jgi:hypothetical protein
MLDKQFVVAACSIGVVYGGVTLGVQHVIGQSAAGVVGVALSALAVAILKQFENLRFKREVSESGTVIKLPRFQMSHLLMGMCAFMGLQVLLGFVVAVVLVATQGPLVLFQYLPRLMAGETKLIAEMAGMTALAFFLGGMLMGRTVPARAAMHAFLAALLTNVLVQVLLVLPALIQDPRNFKEFLKPSTYILGAFWLAYMLAALFGAKAVSILVTKSAKPEIVQTATV